MACGVDISSLHGYSANVMWSQSRILPYTSLCKLPSPVRSKAQKWVLPLHHRFLSSKPRPSSKPSPSSSARMSLLMEMGSRNSMGKSMDWSKSGTELDRRLISLISAKFTCGKEPFIFDLMLALMSLRCPVLVWAELSACFTSDAVVEGEGGGKERGGREEEEGVMGNEGPARLS